MEVGKRKLDQITDVTCVVCPIVYGSLAVWLGKQLDAATHRWTLFVRAPNDEDLSTFVSQVCFTLHPSFPEPLRGERKIGITTIYEIQPN